MTQYSLEKELKETRAALKLLVDELIRPVVATFRANPVRLIEPRDIIKPPRVLSIPRSSDQAIETLQGDQVTEADNVIIAEQEV